VFDSSGGDNFWYDDEKSCIFFLRRVKPKEPNLESHTNQCTMMDRRYDRWGGLLTEILLCDGGDEVVKESVDLHRLQQYAIAFEQAVEAGNLLNIEHMCGVLRQHITGPLNDGTQLHRFLNYVNSPLLDQVIKVYHDPPELCVWTDGWCVVQKACQLGCFDLIDVYVMTSPDMWKRLKQFMYEMQAAIEKGAAPAIALVRKWSPYLIQHHERWYEIGPFFEDNPRPVPPCLMMCDWYRAAVRRGDYDLAEELFSIFCRHHRPTGLEHAIGNSRPSPGWIDAYRKATESINWFDSGVFFTACKYGGLHTDPVLLKAITQEFLAIDDPTRFETNVAQAFHHAAKEGHVGFLDEMLVSFRSRQPSSPWLSVWKVAIKNVFKGVMIGGRIRDMVPISTMLARHCTFGNTVIQFRFTEYEDYHPRLRVRFHPDDEKCHSPAELYRWYAAAIVEVNDLFKSQVMTDRPFSVVSCFYEWNI
jgi:hypothetical protein